MQNLGILKRHVSEIVETDNGSQSPQQGGNTATHGHQTTQTVKSDPKTCQSGDNVLPRAQNKQFSDELNERIKRAGGMRDFNIVERQKFNGVEIRQNLDLRGIRMSDLRTALTTLRYKLTDIVNFSTNLAAPDGVLNIVLRGPSLSCDVCAVLNASNSYNAETFLNEIERVMQSNDRLLSDDSLEFVVNAALNKRGGVRRKLGSVPYDQIIKKKKACLYEPTNTDKNLCFSMCLARHANPQMSEAETQKRGHRIHTSVGFALNHKVSLGTCLNLRII